ncbi:MULTISPECIES: Hsp20/alpha crystallin family protein [Gordonia]|uniref:Hsp20/alpha crystallin family protein n=1 Tax=Gordonia amicalis TaxID=89053 RepID=A0AAE4R390_9ACTN|nr:MULTISPECIES: Hsp20/alpha crystallin family protein [Gordonia]KAF0967379.1 Alpha-crystallin [Gordonia sp. YY1]MCR8897007.1 Hsp20/alpha crystallin family protein [Gordonia sp. GONU]MCZ0912296.1 Hsp20/alpha crystallin family protein [Gordonia amicalis]MCZ4578177.1 Hsp20/alpha crystallin family protein [Gordonia amicalis]MDV6310977.1 Hsp20/alpha crystallin family protein [Gordonia amicalis]
MSIRSARRPNPSWPALPDWSDLMSRFESMPPWGSGAGRLIRVEEHLDEGKYTLRAELPGMDPDKNFDISVRDGRLTIKAEREERSEEGTRTEFHYGSFYRSVPLPEGAKEDDIDATYTDGILTVTMPVSEAPSPEKRIEIKRSPAEGGEGN